MHKGLVQESGKAMTTEPSTKYKREDKQIGIRLDKEGLRRLDMGSSIAGLTRSAYVRHLIYKDTANSAFPPATS